MGCGFDPYQPSGAVLYGLTQARRVSLVWVAVLLRPSLVCAVALVSTPGRFRICGRRCPLHPGVSLLAPGTLQPANVFQVWRVYRYSNRASLANLQQTVLAALSPEACSHARVPSTPRALHRGCGASPAVQRTNACQPLTLLCLAMGQALAQPEPYHHRTVPWNSVLDLT